MSTTAVAAGRRPGAVRTDRAAARIHRLGALNAVVLAVYAVASWGMAVVVPPESPEPIEAAWFESVAAGLGGPAESFVRGDSILAGAGWFVAVYGTLVLASSVLFVGLLALLARARAGLHAGHVRQVHRWAIVFAAVLVCAVPVLVQDFWLSAGWGRLIANGTNPYYVYLDAEVTRGLPLDYLGLLMTYGPLWAVVCGALMLVAGTSGLVAGLLFKALLFGAWLASLTLVRRLLREATPWHQCAGLAIAGWLPVTLIHIMADGHNDIAMVVLILLWLLLLERAPLSATVSLAASVVMKYLSAPLLLLDLLYHTRTRQRPPLSYAPHAALAAIMGLGVVALFYRSPAFFAATAHMADWHFFTPRDAVVAAGRLAGIEPGLQSAAGVFVAALAVSVQLFFVALGVHGVVRYVRTPSADAFRYAVLAVGAGVLFGVAGHLWPWFLTWVILMAALQPSAALSRWTTGVALAAPFPLLIWVMKPGLPTLAWVTPPYYAFALAWLFLAPRSWFGAASSVTDR
jgi:alpha-1,6-mannosyltransferase